MEKGGGRGGAAEGDAISKFFPPAAAPSVAKRWKLLEESAAAPLAHPTRLTR